ncbi:hypothetical protein PHJA_001538000 [Phtheirospermum japonicum]|uniref:BAH domain-containing protein n=1 Tax=Phtheirospermum japonicum TaxID=374723 RepID=A0A830C084_9LAMI|nr:hypothetical protein PHJA_001538000 [Phtheirospermum japonicum]
MFRPQNQKGKSEQEPKGDEDLQFCWGLKKGVITLYESFTLDGIKYSLYDCVYMWRNNQAEPDIGKLVRIWETESREKKVEVVWFFRPVEIANWLGDIKPLRREIFLACGHGKGLSNLAPLEAISGKCNVVCLSKLKRNPQPTEEELRMADYIFYRTFDVRKCTISEKFPCSIGGIEVDHFFNMRKDAKSSVFAEPKAYSKVRSEETPVRAIKNDQSARSEKVACRYRFPDNPTSRQINNSTRNGPSSAVPKVKYTEPVLSASNSDVVPMKKRKLQSAPLGLLDVKIVLALAEGRRDEKRLRDKDSFTEKKDLLTRVSLDENAVMFSEKRVGNKQHIIPAINYKYVEITRKPGMDSSKWFKLEVWDEKSLREMNEKGVLVFLENLDPTFVSADVEDIVWCVFEEKVKAKMVQRTALSSPHSGQAFAIFKTKEAADYVISRLNNECLVLGDGKPIVGRRRSLSKVGSSGGFAGHLNVDRTKPWRQREEIRNAVSTSHFSQSNTIENELAIQWRLLQGKSELWWTALHEVITEYHDFCITNHLSNTVIFCSIVLYLYLLWHRVTLSRLEPVISGPDHNFTGLKNLDFFGQAHRLDRLDKFLFFYGLAMQLAV